VIDRLRKIERPSDVGLAVKRFVVFVLPALVIVATVVGVMIMNAFKPKPEENEEIIKATPVVVAEAVAQRVRLTVTTQGQSRAAGERQDHLCLAGVHRGRRL